MRKVTTCQLSLFYTYYPGRIINSQWCTGIIINYRVILILRDFRSASRLRNHGYHHEISFSLPDVLLTVPSSFVMLYCISVATPTSHLDHALFEQFSRTLKEVLHFTVTNSYAPSSYDLIN